MAKIEFKQPITSIAEIPKSAISVNNNKDILSSDGQLTPPSALDGEATVSLEALVSRGEVSERVVYNFRVPIEGGVK